MVRSCQGDRNRSDLLSTEEIQFGKVHIIDLNAEEIYDELMIDGDDYW